MSKKKLAIDEMQVDANRCMFAEEAGVALVEEEDGKSSIRVKANSGAPILNHWAWGNFAIDLEGLEIGRQSKPILLDHRSNQIVGFTSKISREKEGLVAEGTVLSGESETFAPGNRVRELSEKGFPWQASVYVPPTLVERIPEGAFAKVNGYKLEGPGHIFRKSVLREVTVTSLGADENTDAEMLGEGRREAIVTKLTDSTPPPAESADEPQQLSIDVTSNTEGDQGVTFSGTIESTDSESDVQAALSAERKRVAKLSECAEPHQKAMLSDMIEKGTDLASGLEALLKDQQAKRSSDLKTLVDQSPADLGFTEITEGDGKTEKGEHTETVDAFEQRCSEAFRASAHLQAEFIEESAYVAFCQGEKKIVGERKE